jgi:DNA-directed RNA polymerase specialized sigma subunit
MYTTKGIASSDVLITRHAPLVRRIALQLIARLPWGNA